MRTNVKAVVSRPKPVTREGGPASKTDAQEQLRRAVLSCMLWEDGFYESGQSIAQRIRDLVPVVAPEAVQTLAIQAREEMKLRHVPLLLVREMARHETHRDRVADTLERVIQRADELSEFLSLYWKGGREKVSAQVKKGLARAFVKFEEYALAKYDRNNSAVRLRDVLFICHAKPQTKAQEKLWKRLVNNELKTPDTWETQLSAGADKKETWERLMEEDKLGALAFLRNLRNMDTAGVDKAMIRKYFKTLDVSRVLPFRFITAARHAPQWEAELETLLVQSASARRKLRGHSVILVDISGSMTSRIGARTEINRIDAACGIAMVAREMCDSVSVYVFNDRVGLVPSRRGFALRDAIYASVGGGTQMGAAISAVEAREKYDRLIVITDEQSQDRVPSPTGRGYILNVASEKNGVGYGSWTHVHGWSEAVLDYIGSSEG